MRTLIATLVFAKGKKVAAKAEARWEGEPVQFRYVGDVSVLQPFTNNGTLEFLEWYLRGIAGSYGAELTTTWGGEYEPRPGRAEPVVLVAEDETNDFVLLELAFRQNRTGSRLVRAHNGEEALEYVKGEGRFPNREEHPFPRLMLLDLKMPRMNGFEVLQHLTGLKIPELPVVVLSASPLEADIKRARELGAKDYLVKPTEFNAAVKLARSVHDRWLSPTGTLNR
jgi:CheY-like chemotaxis protein